MNTTQPKKFHADEVHQRIDAENGVAWYIIKTDAGRFRVLCRDTDADQNVPFMVEFPTIERAIELVDSSFPV